MLQFFKKSGRPNSSHDRNNASLTHQQKQKLSKRHSMPVVTTFLNDNNVLDETFAGYCSHDGEQCSRLSKNLREILSDKNCLSYFVQFLDKKDALSLIKFFLDVESFKAVAEQSKNSAIRAVKELKRKSLQNCDSRRNSTSDVGGCGGNGGGGGAGVITETTAEVSKSTSSEGYDSLSVNSFDVCDRISISSQSECALHSSNDVQQFDEDETSLKSLGDLSNRTACKLHTKSPEDNTNVSDRSVVSDAIRIYKKYLITNSPYFIDVPSTILSGLSLILCSRKDDGKMLSSIPANVFEEAQNFVLTQLERDYLNEFLESVYYCRYCVEILSSGSLKLADILYSETALFYFMEFLEQENKRNYLEFWMAATNFRKHYRSVTLPFSKTDALNDAMILYEKYFSLQATCPLAVSDSVRCDIEQRICAADNDDIINCFELPLQIIEGYFTLNYLNAFLVSPLFTNYLKELQIKLEGDRNIDLLQNVFKQRSQTGHRRHRKTLSDCTLESTIGIRKNSFISEQNTLLAMESSSPRTRPSNESQTLFQAKAGDMHIDLRQLTDPDLLWYRNNTTTNGAPLTFGRVDALGRYERDFELLGAQEDKWSLSSGGNRLRNAVRKLVNLPEDRVQEEIAWQVAEMIVKDVTSVTLGKNEQINNSSTQ